MLNSDGKLICPEVRIENTNFCNANCVICPREKMTRPLVTMHMGKFCTLVEQVYRLGATSIGIFGFGEPLMDKGIVEKVEYAKKRGLETHITTNASLLGIPLAQALLSAGLDHIRFSVHATSFSNYRQIHKNLDYLDVIKNIGNFLDLNKNFRPKCTTHITCIPVMAKSDMNDAVDEIREMWESRVDYLEIWRPHNWGGVREYRNGDVLKPCNRPFSGPVQIQADGMVIPCCFLTNAEIVLGDTYNESLLDILQNGSYAKFREAHRKDELNGFPCATCDQRFDYADTSPLLYSNRDPKRNLNVLSTSKIRIKED